MKRLRILPVVCLLLGGLVPGATPAADAAPAARPNIVLIVTDDQRVGLLAIEGYPTADEAFGL